MFNKCPICLAWSLWIGKAINGHNLYKCVNESELCNGLQFSRWQNVVSFDQTNWKIYLACLAMKEAEKHERREVV